MLCYAEAMKTRRRYTICGQVQGVGFRPFVYRLAMRYALTGFVSNTSEGVFLEVQSNAETMAAFDHALRNELPPLAHVVSLEYEDMDRVDGEEAFSIVASSGHHGHHVLISPDMSTCDDCIADMNNAKGKRYRYAFTNCTNCGPRYTITRSIPYDRDKTSMACFPLCPDCAKEYSDPLDRRFHAQPNACPECGPSLWYVGHNGKNPDAEYPTDLESAAFRDHDAMRKIAADVVAGKVAAIKGLGGFHLACDATNEQAVQTLRQRKSRPHKPLAIMVPDMESVRRIACPTPEEEALILSQERPIVLCRALGAGENTGISVAPSIAPYVGPDTPYIGIMLPYTPLHHVLFQYLKDVLQEKSHEPLCALVMTSGNAGGEPICLGNREALRRLAHIADVFLLHNRDILIRTDDSVVRHIAGQGIMFMRRARGFVPRPIELSPIYKDTREADAPMERPCVLATGPELKNTLSLSRAAKPRDMAFVSQHIGDMHNLETFGFYQEIAAHLADILQVTPKAIVCDKHPDYMTSHWAEEYAKTHDVPLLKLQHHYAHAYSVLAENQHDGAAICLVLDGTGYGDDGTIWGGECLLVNTKTLEQRRLGHLQTIPLAGGEAAIREPWRIAQGLVSRIAQGLVNGIAQGLVNGIAHANIEADANDKNPPTLPWLPEYEQASSFVDIMIERGINTPYTSSCGRLFDAVAAMLGLCQTVTFEGQAAIILEQVQDMRETKAYACPFTVEEFQGPDAPQTMTILDTHTLFAQVYADWHASHDTGLIARRFHLGLIEGLADMAAFWAKRHHIEYIGLSGGVMQNATLAAELPKALRRRGLVPLCHSQLPPNDGSLSLGQLAYGTVHALHNGT